MMLGLILSGMVVAAEETTQKLPITDVAINKPVYASSVLNQIEADKSYIVDNEDEGAPTYWRPSDSDSKTSAYVIVDLTQKYPISRIELDTIGKRNFSISLSNDITDSSSWITVHKQGNTRFEGDTLTVYPMVGKNYRFVRVKREFGPGMADEYAISSLRVYAPSDYNLKQIATGKTATANTNGQGWASASNVTDGNYNSMVFADRGDHPPYVTIDLGEETDVRRVEIMHAMADTYYYNMGIQPHGGDLREGSGDGRYDIYMSDEALSPDMFEASAEKVARYEMQSSYGLAHGITAFDIKASKPYRYLHIWTNDTNSYIIAEIFVYKKADETVAEEKITENIFAGVGCAAQSGNGEAKNINDNDEGTEWVMESADDYATFTLPGTFNIENIDIITDSAPGSIEIWGGKTEDFASDTAKVKLFGGETVSASVTAGYVADYITVKAGNDAQFPVSVKELSIYAEEGFRLINIGETAETSDKNLNDGKFESVTVEAPSISVNTVAELEAVEIYFGDMPQGRRNVALYGGVSKNNIQPIATIDIRSASSELPYTVILKGEQKSYKYFEVQNVADAIRGGINVNGKYSFNETRSEVSVKEIAVYAKKENTPPPTSELEVISAEAVDGEGNAIEVISEKTGAKLVLKNGSIDEKAVVICAAVDSDNIILSTGIQSVELLAGEEQEITVYAENIPDEATEVKVFVWKGFGTNQIPHLVHKTLIQGGN